MKKLLITGSNSQLAKSFINLYNNKYNIFSKDRFLLDITSNSKVQESLIEVKPDIILHCAAFTDVDGCERDKKVSNEINAYSIKNFKENFNGLFIYISTDYIFDGENGPYYEDDLPNPINNYGNSKLMGELEVKKLFKNYLIVRSNVIFDINSKASFLDWVIKSLSKSKKINVVNDQIGNPVWTYDLSRSINFFIERNFNGVIHVGSDKIISRFDFAKKIAKVWDFDDNLIQPISSDDLFSSLDSYIAKRPLNSGLLTKFDVFPKISLLKSLKEIHQSYYK